MQLLVSHWGFEAHHCWGFKVQCTGLPWRGVLTAKFLLQLFQARTKSLVQEKINEGIIQRGALRKNRRNDSCEGRDMAYISKCRVHRYNGVGRPCNEKPGDHQKADFGRTFSFGYCLQSGCSLWSPRCTCPLGHASNGPVRQTIACRNHRKRTKEEKHKNTNEERGIQCFRWAPANGANRVSALRNIGGQTKHRAETPHEGERPQKCDDIQVLLSGRLPGKRSGHSSASFNR